MGDKQKLKTDTDQVDHDYINRTIIVHPKQSVSFSKLIRKLHVFQDSNIQLGLTPRRSVKQR